MTLLSVVLTVTSADFVSDEDGEDIVRRAYE